MPQTWKENQEGLHEAYYSHCSFRSPDPGRPRRDQSTQRAESALRQEGARRGRASTGMSPLDRKMLDLVIGGARDLRRTLSPDRPAKAGRVPRQRSLVERRIAAIELRQKEAALEKAGVRSSRRNESDSPPIEIKIPEGDKRSEYMQVMCDLNVLAFQTDTTRVSTYIGSTPERCVLSRTGIHGQASLADSPQQPDQRRSGRWPRSRSSTSISSPTW